MCVRPTKAQDFADSLFYTQRAPTATAPMEDSAAVLCKPNERVSVCDVLCCVVCVCVCVRVKVMKG